MSALMGQLFSYLNLAELHQSKYCGLLNVDAVCLCTDVPAIPLPRNTPVAAYQTDLGVDISI